MGSDTNFSSFGDTSPVYGLARQSSVYSLTFDEFQNSLGGLGKDYGSMNMDELLKSIWSAEETQMLASNSGGGAGGISAPNGSNLQRQGSITLPRTLSQKTVDDVWREFMVKECDVNKDSNSNSNINGNGNSINGVAGLGSNLPQRQQTLGEMTLEEFLVIAGIVREDASQSQAQQQIGRTFNATSNANTNTTSNAHTNDLAFGLPQPMQMNNSALNQPSSLPLSFGGARSSPPQQQQLVFSKPPATPALTPPQKNLMTPGARKTSPGMVGFGEPASLVQSRAVLPLPPSRGVTSLGNGSVTVGGVAPTATHFSPDVIVKTCMDSPTSLSPVPYMFNRRGKCGAALEKVIERRQKRMIKNRESAARSRARKQAYTLELEAEIAKLKETNEELQRKQEEMLEIQKNQILESMNQQWGNKRPCLRRTFTGPW